MHRQPSTQDDNDLPDIPKWTITNPSYIAFRKEGVAVGLDYAKTYNQYMRENLPTTTTNGSTRRAFNTPLIAVIVLLLTIMKP